MAKSKLLEQKQVGSYRWLSDLSMCTWILITAVAYYGALLFPSLAQIASKLSRAYIIFLVLALGSSSVRFAVSRTRNGNKADSGLFKQ